MLDLIASALRQGGFRLFAQPVVPLDDGLPGMHAEVLLRLENEAGPLLLPGQFLPHAVRHGLGPAVDHWVLEHALAWLYRHRDALSIEMLTINLSDTSLADPDFQRQLLRQLDGMPAGLRQALGGEIAESALFAAPAAVAALVPALRLRGIRVALDDCCAEPEVLKQLQRLHFDLIKIDRAQIAALDDDGEVSAAVQRCVAVARTIGGKTVAEGVETSAVLEQVRRAGINYAQGLLLAAPASLAELSTCGSRPGRQPRTSRFEGSAPH